MNSGVIHHRCPRCDESIFFDGENQICDKCEWGLDEGDDEDETTTEKGDRNEREAANIIGCARGSGNVEKVNARANTDPFSIADVIAIGGGEKVLFVQVKTNRFSAKARRRYKQAMRRLPHDHAMFEVWVRVDYEGWRMYRYGPESGEFEQYLEMDTCDHDETIEAYRDAVGYYDDRTQDTDTDRSGGATDAD